MEFFKYKKEKNLTQKSGGQLINNIIIKNNLKKTC
jgi:hypothetical protein